MIKWLAALDALQWISLVSGICSIVALPIAIWQILAIKSRVNATEEGIQKILFLKDREKLESVKNSLSDVQDGIRDLQNLSTQPGNSKITIAKRTTEILKNLDHCILELPASETDIETSLKKCVEEIQKFQKEDVAADHLKEAADDVYASIHQIKQALERRENKEIEIASKSS